MAVADVHVVSQGRRAAYGRVAIAGRADRAAQQQFQRLVGHRIVALKEPHEKADIVAPPQNDRPGELSLAHDQLAIFASIRIAINEHSGLLQIGRRRIRLAD